MGVGGVGMLVRFNEISPHGSQFIIHEVRGLADQDDLVVQGPLVAECSLERKGESKVALQGKIVVEVLLPCDRCLCDYPFRVDTAFQLLFALEDDEAWQVKALESIPSDLETEVLTEPVIDLDDVLRQQVYLALPVKSLCSPSCAGLCLQCGTNLNETTCECSKTGKKSPFAALAQLKK